MAEIKSTLDLVMEKTKNLKLSNEEKQDQKNTEIESRLRGLLQKFEDQLITLERFKSEYQALRKEYNLSANEHLIKEICGQIELGEDNQALFELLAEFKLSDLEGLATVLQEFQTVLDTAAGQRRKILKDRLGETHFISGSAVVPHLESDPGWRKMVEEIRAEFEAKLNQERTDLLA